jgi:hypothetical protein
VKRNSLGRLRSLVVALFPCPYYSASRQETNLLSVMVFVDLFLVLLPHHRSLLPSQLSPPPSFHHWHTMQHLHLPYFFHRKECDSRILRLLHLSSSCIHSVLPHQSRWSLHSSLPLPSLQVQIKIFTTVRTSWSPPRSLLCQSEKQVYHYLSKKYF